VETLLSTIVQLL